MEEGDRWRRCSSCKAPIAYGATYWVCNVSTCNRGRTALAFCTVSCWDAHLGVVNHRESWALERKAPTREAWQRELAGEGAREGPSGAAARPARNGAASSGAGPTGGGAAGTGSATPTAREPGAGAPRRILPPPSASPARGDAPPRDALIVMSKLKAYIRARAGMNTSDRVVTPLSDAVRALCERAIERARREGRRTVLERDFDEP